MQTVMSLVCIGVGIFSICGAVCDWNFFMNNYKAQVFVKLFGRNGARIFYGILGAFIIVCGVLALTGA